MWDEIRKGGTRSFVCLLLVVHEVIRLIKENSIYKIFECFPGRGTRSRTLREIGDEFYSSPFIPHYSNMN